MDSPNRMLNMNSGSQNSICSTCSKPKRSIMNPFWKTSTTSPYAAPTDSRFMMIDAIEIVMDRKANSNSTKLSASTVPITIGMYSSVIFTESTTCAETPPT